MTIAAQAIERMKAHNCTIAQAANDLQSESDQVDEVDGIYKFYSFRDGSKVGCRLREEEHAPRWPKELQQVWEVQKH